MKTKVADLLVNCELKILESNRKFRQMVDETVDNLGAIINPQDIAIVKDIMATLGRTEEKTCACRMNIKNGETWIAVTIGGMETGNCDGLFRVSLRVLTEMLETLTVLSEKVSDLEYSRAEISEKANLDFGMQVYNKEAITCMAKEAMKKDVKGGIYLCIIDIDNFKQVNDIYGHLYGDEVLAKVAAIIKEVVGKSGCIGRIGGDEIMLFFNTGFSHAEVRTKLKTIREHVAASYVTANNERLVTVSMGVAKYPDDALCYDDIFTIADKMLYLAKEKGKNRYIIYTPELHGNVLNPDSDNQSVIEPGINKERYVQDVLQKFLVEQRYSYGYLLKTCAKAFNLDEAMVVFSSGKIFNKYEQVVDNLPRDFSFLYDEMLQAAFNEQQILTLNNVNSAEGKSAALVKYMQDHGIMSMLIYKAAYNGIEAFFIFSRKSSLTRAWETKDILLLEVFGKALELGIGDR